jgi:hypothetical protein
MDMGNTMNMLHRVKTQSIQHVAPRNSERHALAVSCELSSPQVLWTLGPKSRSQSARAPMEGWSDHKLPLGNTP